jgi:hypothetical protein
MLPMSIVTYNIVDRMVVGGTLATVNTILPVSCMKFLHDCHFVGVKFEVYMQNESYRSVG